MQDNCTLFNFLECFALINCIINYSLDVVQGYERDIWIMQAMGLRQPER